MLVKMFLPPGIVFLVAFALLASVTGSSAQLPPVVDLRTTAAPLTIVGAAPGDVLGSQLATLDMDGDGLSDLAVFAQNASPLGRTDAGLLYVVRGQAAFPPVIDLAVAGTATQIVPPLEADGFWSRLAAGDFNNDGYADLVLTDPCGGPACGGRSFIIQGSETLPENVDLQSAMDGVTRIVGGNGYNGFGVAAGDVNGDDFDDLVLASPVYGLTSRVYIILGRALLPASVNLAVSDPMVITLIDPEYGWATGRSLACGDVNQDGYDDVLIGSPGDVEPRFHGKATLLYGSSDLPSVINLNDPLMRIMHFYSDTTEYGRFGGAVAIADITRDGYGDVLISADNADTPQYVDCGKVFLLPGGAQLRDSIRTDDAGSGFVHIGAGGNFRYAGSFLAVGDMTGERYCDVAITDRPVASDTAMVTLLYGASSFPDTLDLGSCPGKTQVLGYYGALFGCGLGMGDFDGNQFGDLAIGAPYASPQGRQHAGRVSVLFGSGTLSAIAPVSRAPRLQIRPNPFASSTAIAYDLGHSRTGRATIHDVSGRTVRTFVLRSARGELVWDGKNEAGVLLPSGVYFCRLGNERGSAVRKIVLLR